MITYAIEGMLPGDDSWHIIYTASADLTTIEELIRTLGLYRTNHPDASYRLVKHEVIG
jgi:hypothetical protein